MLSFDKGVKGVKGVKKNVKGVKKVHVKKMWSNKFQNLVMKKYSDS
jgi:hypothetical protein